MTCGHPRHARGVRIAASHRTTGIRRGRTAMGCRRSCCLLLSHGLLHHGVSRDDNALAVDGDVLNHFAVVAGDGPGVGGDGPGVGGDGPGVGGDGPGVGGDGPGVVGDGPVVDGDGPGVVGDGPGVVGDGSIVDGDGPGVVGDGPGVGDN